MSETQVRWLVTGASGQLGGHVVQQLTAEADDQSILALAGRGEVGTPGVNVRRIDLRDENSLRACVAEYRPSHLIHLGAMTAVADAHAHPEDAERINVQATRILAESAAECGASMLFSSTDMVFDGTAAPYCESDPPCPLSQYGRSKVAAERLLADMDHVLVVRLSLMVGFACAARETTFARQMATLRNGEPLRLFTDEFRTPGWLGDAARAVIGLARSDQTGLIHVAGPERLSRYQMIEKCARGLGIADAKFEPVSRMSIQSPEPRPADLSLDDSLFRQQYPQLAPGYLSNPAVHDRD